MTEPGDARRKAIDERYEDLTPEERQAQYEQLQQELHAHPGYLECLSPVDAATFENPLLGGRTSLCCG